MSMSPEDQALFNEYCEAMETRFREIQDELSCSYKCAIDVMYLRTRSRWTQELEDQLVTIYKNDPEAVINMGEFGCTRETGTNLLKLAKERL